MAKKKQQQPIKLHCKIDEKAYSRALFLCRIFTGGTLVYLAVGSLLYWREFLTNTAVLGFPFAVPVSFGLSSAELFLGLFLLLGWYTRLMALIALPLAGVCAVIFFAGQYNNVFVALCLLLCAPLSTLLLLGSGAISLDYKRSQRAAQEFFRG